MVSIISSELVVPSEATPKTPLSLSNLDLAGRMAHTPMVYFYRPIDRARHDFFFVESLKSSLAKALVPFYPLASRLGMDQDGRIEIKCTGEGVLFVVARSDIMLHDFDSFAPSSEVRNLYVPRGGQSDSACIPLLVQVTFFKCGGVALGTALHHQVVDGRSAFHFMETWSRIACGDDSCIVPPFFDHTLLAAKPDRKVMFDHLEYKSNPKSIIPSGISTLYVSSVLQMSNKHIDALKFRCSDTAGTHVSAFRAITALLWRCFCGEKKLDLKSETRLYTMIDIRNRMYPPLPPTYFGNAVIRVSVSAMVNDVMSSPISHVAKMVHGATNHGDDYARLLIDYLETVGMENLPRSGVPTSELRVISFFGMPTDKADFGWGKPIFCAPAYYSGYIYLMDSPGKEAGVSAVVSLEPETMSVFKKLFLEELAALDVSEFISNDRCLVTTGAYSDESIAWKYYHNKPCLYLA